MGFQRDKMNKIEVNPRLFITCRLCLEDLGIYQIVPAVKEQISYCFDISVEPFDGLPQLICKKCEAILSNYSEIKKKFTAKQNDLRGKIKGSSNGQVSLLQTQSEDSIKNLGSKSNNQNLCRPRKRKACISSSSSESEHDETVKENKNENSSYRNEETPESWPASYTKQYVCKICNSRWLDIKLLRKHINSRHSGLNKKYSHIFKTHCEVRLHKTDGKLNVTGSNSKVMYRKEKIIQNVSAKYYIIYTTKGYKDDDKHNEVRNAMPEETDRTNDYESSESSADEIVFKHKRKRRICSKSSSDTVVLDTANKSNMSDNDKESHKSGEVQTSIALGDCINIDDSSDSESENVNCAKEITDKLQKSDINSQDLKVDETIINDVIASCQNKYMKKHYHDNLLMKASKSPSEIAIQLKRKIISIGRKIINKKIGVNCTPLLRFMEHKNLDIIWLPREFVHKNQESNYVRIMTRMKNIGENNAYESGWTNYAPSMIQNYGHSAVTSISDKIVEVSRSEPINAPNGSDISEDPCVSVPEITLTESAVLICDANLIGTDTKKLLNANPVANPKQLPKKSLLKQASSNVDDTIHENTEKDYCMPIITSTTSLAVPLIQENIDASNKIPKITSSKIDDRKSEAPRIKVKPVSELMSVETLNRMQEPTRLSCIVNSNQPLPGQNEDEVNNAYVSQIDTAQQFQNTVQPNNVSMNLIAPEPAWQNEFMILDTIELPNTKTNSPFLYFKQLLQLHNIILLDTDAELSQDFNCLIKFKVLYKQDNKNQPVILCLSMLCLNNVFCLKIKDCNHENLDLSKISPNWQWEVLKIYKGEVVSKLLSNAQKISQDVYDFTNCFLCLLKSINSKKVL